MDEFDAAFEGLYRVAYRVAFRILGSHEETEDVAQEALVRAYVSCRRIRKHAPAWVARVSANLAIDRWRTRRRIAAAPVPEQAGSDPWQPDRVDLVRALRSLPRGQREIVVLRYLADQSEQSVAVALGCSTGTVKSQAARGLAALRSHFAQAPAGG